MLNAKPTIVGVQFSSETLKWRKERKKTKKILCNTFCTFHGKPLKSESLKNALFRICLKL